MANKHNTLVDARATLNSHNNDDILIEVSDSQRRKLQKAILEMYKDLLDVCNRYGITPYLIGGSALGAVRHEGFIPWDDDIDVGMIREDYNRFLEVFETEMATQYILNAPNYSDEPKARFA